MSDQPGSHHTAKAVTLAILLMAASPLAAQDTAPLPGDTQASDSLTVPTPVGDAAPQEADPQEADPAPTPQPEALPETDTAADPEAVTDSSTAPSGEAATSDAAPAPAAQPAPQSSEPAADDQPAAPDPAAPAPAVSGNATDPASAENTLLPDSIQRAIAPLLDQPARDPNLPHDLSPIGMYQQADWVVKAVMLGLIFASIITWTILLVKSIEIWRASARVARTRRRIEDAADLPDVVQTVGKRGDPASRMVRVAMKEYSRSLPAITQNSGEEGLKERVGSHLDQIEAQTGRNITRGTGLLATIASTAPFVGLFGTVWGIMNSFIGIAESQTTNLAVVAPGIAEALLATAIGLVAAIPAVIFYNVFARWITGYRQRLSFAAAGVQRLVSRDLDFRKEA